MYEAGPGAFTPTEHRGTSRLRCTENEAEKLIPRAARALPVYVTVTLLSVAGARYQHTCCHHCVTVTMPAVTPRLAARACRALSNFDLLDTPTKGHCFGGKAFCDKTNYNHVFFPNFL